MAFFSASYSPWSDHAATAVVAATWKGRKAGMVISEGNNGVRWKAHPRTVRAMGAER
jgi:hypothetical protein